MDKTSSPTNILGKTLNNMMVMVSFYGISTTVGYLKPNTVNRYILDI